MSGAIMFVDRDLNDRSSIARTAQVADIYAKMGLAVDLVLIGNEGQADLPRPLSDRIRNFASLPRPENGRISQTVISALWQTVNDQIYSICHCVNVGLDIPWKVAGCRVAEPGTRTAPAGDWDIVLAETEAARGSITGTDAERLRLPFRPMPVRLDAEGSKIGWIGGWSHRRIEAWSDVLAHLSRTGAEPVGALLLTGSGARDVSVPDNLVHRVAAGAGDAHPSVLGLAIAPGDELADDHRIAATRLMMDKPILITSDAADVHEGRWHLPTPGEPGEIVRMIFDWVKDPTLLKQQTQSTRLAYLQDLDAMTAHIAGQISSRIRV